jgi:hypothetical protein
MCPGLTDCEWTFWTTTATPRLDSSPTAVAGVTRPAEVVLADAVEASRRFLVEAHSFVRAVGQTRWPSPPVGQIHPSLVPNESSSFDSPRLKSTTSTSISFTRSPTCPCFWRVSCSSTSSNTTTAWALTLRLSLTTVPEVSVGSRVGISPSCVALSPRLWRG